MIRKILKADNPKLRLKSKAVKKVDKKIKLIAKDLIDTLSIQVDPEGVGLAAPQIGKNLKMFAMVYGKSYKIIINPQIISISKSRKTKGKTIMEGCLSVPYFYGPLKRPQRLTLKYTNLQGKIVKEEFRGFPAQIVQHEVDHLNGILFVDKLIKQKKSLYKLNNDVWEEVDLPTF